MARMLKLHGVKRYPKDGNIETHRGLRCKGWDLKFFKEPIESYCPETELPVPPGKPVSDVSPVLPVRDIAAELDAKWNTPGYWE